MSSQQQQDKLKAEGNALVQKQQFEEAATIYTKALELDSTSEAAAAIFSNRSLCNLNTKKYSEALQDAEKAIALRPTWLRGYQRAAAACEKLEKHEEGLKHLEMSFELDEASKNDAEFKEMKATFELNIVKQKAPSMTQDELKKVGDSLAQKYQYQNAIDIYTLAIEKNAFCDEAVPILSERSLCYFTIGKYKEAYEDGGFCCGIKPDWAKGFLHRATAAQRLEEWQIALESYDEYLKLDPKDEAGVKKNRKAVAKIIAEKKKEQEEKQREFAATEREIASIRNSDEKHARVYTELLMGGRTFNIEQMKMALRQTSVKPRLDRFFRNQPFFFRDGHWRNNLTPRAMRHAEKNYYGDEGIQTILEMCMIAFEDKTKRDTPINTQVAYLDFLLDVAEEQDFSAPAVMTKVCLAYLCWHDPTSKQFATIRKDLIITLFNRIDIARQVFLGKSASKKDFATLVLSQLVTDYDPIANECRQLGTNPFPSGPVDPNGSQLQGDVTSDVCTRSMYECIQTALQHGANPLWVPKKGSAEEDEVEEEGSILDRAVSHLRSVQVVELMLRHGADVNLVTKLEQQVYVSDTTSFISSSQGRLPRAQHLSTPSNSLSRAFATYRTDIIGILMTNGARLPPTGHLSKSLLKSFPIDESKNPLVKPQYSSHLSTAFVTRGKKRIDSVLTEDYLRYLFEAVDKQNLSYLCPDVPSSDRSNTPLTLAVTNRLNISVVEIMIKLKPALLNMLANCTAQGNIALAPSGLMIYALAQDPSMTLAYASSAIKLFKKYGVDFNKDPAQTKLGSSSSSDAPMTALELSDAMISQTPKGPAKSRVEALKKVMLEK